MKTIFIALLLAVAACDNTEYQSPPDFPSPPADRGPYCPPELSSVWLACQCFAAPDSGWPESCWAHTDACRPYENAAISCDLYPRNCGYNPDGKYVCQYAPRGTYGDCVCYRWPYTPGDPPWTPPQ